jgi:hypothetical protein
MSTPHKHAELIKAWADGATIEWQASNGNWMVDKEPNWGYPNARYRIKPEPKPDIVRWVYGNQSMGYRSFDGACFEHTQPNLKLTFDGETGKLKTAEVL